MKRLIILFHGYCSNTEIIAKVFQPLIDQFNDDLFFAPNGLYPCNCRVNNGEYANILCQSVPSNDSSERFSWFEIDPTEMEKMLQQITAIQDQLKKWINQLLKKYQLTYDDLILIGHSQGAILALYLTYFVLPPCRGTISYAGMLPLNGLLPRPELNIPGNQSSIFHRMIKLNQTNTLLIHGEKDMIIPYKESVKMGNLINELGGKSEVKILPNDGHSITESGLLLINEFLEK